MKKTFNELAKVSGYHIHIYFTPQTPSQKIARDILNDLKKSFGAEIEESFELGRVGPHLTPNIALHITKNGFNEIVPWLQINNRDLSILIHPETGDDLKDHLQASMWLGKQLGYNDDFFAKFKKGKKPSR